MQTARTSVKFLRLLIPQQTWPGCFYRGTQTQTPRLKKAVKKSSSFGEGGYILLVIPVTAFCLGTWQVKRRWWKLDLIKTLEEKTQSAPVLLPHNLEEVVDLEYRPVTFRGVFDHSKEMTIGPRSNVLKEGGGLVSASNQTGANIVTPLKLSDRQESILVNRGWVPSSQIDPRTRQAGQVEGEVEVTGIVRLQEQTLGREESGSVVVLSSWKKSAKMFVAAIFPRSPFMPQSDPKSQGFWLYRDTESMARQAGTAPVFVDQNLRTSTPGGPTGGQTRVTLRNEHMSYIITWYTLSAITFTMWFRRYRRPAPPDSAVDYIKKQQRP